MFKLTDKQCTLTDVNPRQENHGEDHQLACDLKFKLSATNPILNEFDPALRELLFKPGDPETMDLADQGTDHDDEYGMVMQRFPEMGAIPWGWEGAGYRMVIGQGFTGDSDIILINTELDKFKINCQDGGMVEIEFRLIGHPTEEEIGRLCALIKSDVELTLEPPSAEQLAQMEIEEHTEEEEDEDAA